MTVKREVQDKRRPNGEIAAWFRLSLGPLHAFFGKCLQAGIMPNAELHNGPRLFEQRQRRPQIHAVVRHQAGRCHGGSAATAALAVNVDTATAAVSLQPCLDEGRSLPEVLQAGGCRVQGRQAQLFDPVTGVGPKRAGPLFRHVQHGVHLMCQEGGDVASQRSAPHAEVRVDVRDQLCVLAIEKERPRQNAREHGVRSVTDREERCIPEAFQQ